MGRAPEESPAAPELEIFDYPGGYVERKDGEEYARRRIAAIPGVSVKRSSPTFNEFTVELPTDAAEVVGAMIDKGFAAGFPLGRYYPGMERCLLVAVTEKRTKEEIGAFAEALEGVL